MIGIVIGYSGVYLIYVPQINELNIKYDTLELQSNNLQDNYDALEQERDILQDEYDDLKQHQNDLQDMYASLSSEHSALQTDYSSTINQYVDLSNDLLDFEELLWSYCIFEESFSRVLCESEVNEVSSIVSSITSSSDLWYSYENIYDYIVNNVVPVNDIPLPYIHSYEYMRVDGYDVLTSITTDTRSEYVQTPQVTLELGQGDCDDQTVLAYAMIRYYDKYIHGTEYPLYIASIYFSEGGGHATVFLPVANGELCIIDPTSYYLTNSYGSIATKDASSELQKYKSIWAVEEITTIELYEVNITTGTSTLVKSGSLNQIADFLET
jgi:hypothetical protein